MLVKIGDLTKFGFFVFVSFQILGETDTHYQIHYVGYGPEWDTEIPKDGLINRVNESEQLQEHIPLEGRVQLLKSKLALLIKDHLTFHRDHDPVVTLRLDCDPEVYYEIFGNLTSDKVKSGLKFNNEDLNGIFKTNWDRRILNKYGEYSCIVDNSVIVSLRKKRCLREFVQNEDGYLVEEITEKGHILTFRFVRTEGKLAM